MTDQKRSSVLFSANRALNDVVRCISLDEKLPCFNRKLASLYLIINLQQTTHHSHSTSTCAINVHLKFRILPRFVNRRLKHSTRLQELAGGRGLTHYALSHLLERTLKDERTLCSFGKTPGLNISRWSSHVLSFLFLERTVFQSGPELRWSEKEESSTFDPKDNGTFCRLSYVHS